MRVCLSARGRAERGRRVDGRHLYFGLDNQVTRRVWGHFGPNSGGVRKLRKKYVSGRRQGLGRPTPSLCADPHGQPCSGDVHPTGSTTSQDENKPPGKPNRCDKFTTLQPCLG